MQERRQMLYSYHPSFRRQKAMSWLVAANKAKRSNASTTAQPHRCCFTQDWISFCNEEDLCVGLKCHEQIAFFIIILSTANLPLFQFTFLHYRSLLPIVSISFSLFFISSLLSLLIYVDLINILHAIVTLRCNGEEKCSTMKSLYIPPSSFSFFRSFTFFF